MIADSFPLPNRDRESVSDILGIVWETPTFTVNLDIELEKITTHLGVEATIEVP